MSGCLFLSMESILFLFYLVVGQETGSRELFNSWNVSNGFPCKGFFSSILVPSAPHQGYLSTVYSNKLHMLH